MKWLFKLFQLSKLKIPLAAKLTLVMTGLISLAVGSQTYISIYRNERIFYQELEQQAEVLLTTLTISAGNSLDLGNVELVKDLIDELSVQKMFLSSRAYQQDGRIIADTETHTQSALNLKGDPFGYQILRSKTTLLDWQKDRLLAGKAILIDGKPIGAIAVELSTASIQQKKIAERNQSILLGLSLGAIGITISLWLSQSITEPLKQLTEATEELSQGYLDLQIEIHSNDELAILANSFNLMTTQLKESMRYLEESEYYAYLKATQLEQTLEELRQAKELAEAGSLAKSKFLSNMSHELRTPLNGILGYAQILRRDATLTAQQIKGLDTIYISGDHLLTLINDILDLSKIEAGKLQLFTNDFHLQNFIEGIISIMAMEAHSKNLEFNYQISPFLPIGIHADEKRLRQVLLNLLSNAIKFTDYGKVALNITLVKPVGEQLAIASRQTLRFEVTDTGIGITPEQIDQVFQPFEQAGDPSQQIKGTGLGLAITKQLVELMGGELQVSSELGKGSCFWFEVTLPVVKSAISITEQTTEIPLIVGYQGKRRKILVVDDKTQNRQVLLNLLEPLGFEIFLGKNGQEEIELAQKIQPDCILTDLVMPIKTGFEAVKEIRQNPQLQNVVIIAISASILSPQSNQIIGCEAFLPKPVEVEKLLALLQQYLQLDWIYEAKNKLPPTTFTTQTTPWQELVYLPPAEVTHLHNLALLGNMKKIHERALYLQELDEKYIDLSLELQSLAAGFHEKAILNLVENFLQPLS